jgi:hypothetical protein
VPYLYCEMFPCSPLTKCIILGWYDRVLVGGFTVRGDDVGGRYTQTLLDISAFIRNLSTADGADEAISDPQGEEGS